MRVLILAAGYGSRLKPITNLLPKCMIHINNTPIIEIWIRKLINLGFKEIYINTHYKQDVVIDHIHKLKNLNNFVKFFKEDKLLGTAGTIINNYNNLCDQDLLLLHCDNICEDSLIDFLKCHENRNKKSVMTLLSFHTQYFKNFGMLELKNNIVENFEEKPSFSNSKIANGAIYALSKKCVHEIFTKHNKAKDFSKDIIPKFLGRISNYTTNKLLVDIGTLDNYNKYKNYNFK